MTRSPEDAIADGALARVAEMENADAEGADVVGVDAEDVDAAGAEARVADGRLVAAALIGWGVLLWSLGHPTSVHLVLGAVLLATSILAVVRARGRSRALMLALTLAVSGLLQVGAFGHRSVEDVGPLVELVAARAVVVLDVVVASDPLPVAGRDGHRVLVQVDVRAVEGRGVRSRARGRLLLVGSPELLALRWHERIRVTGRLGPPDPGRAELGWLRITVPPHLLERPGPVARGAEGLRAGLRAAVADAPADARGLLPGLVLGDTSATPPDLTEAMRSTGMSHLTAVSGSNVSIVLGLVLWLASLVGVPRRARPVLAGLMLAGFVVVVRPEPSVLRAAAMGAIGLLGLLRSRRGSGLAVLGGAVIAILVVDPWLARSYGFALSTLATLGLLVFVRPWGEAIARRLPPWARLVGPAVAVPVAAQCLTAPVVVLLQGSVSLIGVLANILAAPLVAPATVAGVAAALVSTVSPVLASWVAWVAILPTLGVARIARWAGDVPGGTLPWPDGVGGALLLAAVTIGALVYGRSAVLIGRRHPVAAVAAALLIVAALLPTRLVTWPPTSWQLVACDVGQGDALVLRSGPQRAVLVDAGPDPSAVDGCLDRLGVRALDAVVLTHFHADHVDGLSGALQGRSVRSILVSPVREPAEGAEAVDREAQAHGIPVGVVRAGDQLDLGQVQATVWSPSRRIGDGSVPNNASVVLAVTVGGLNALLLGDIEREAAHDLLLRARRDPGLGAAAGTFDVLKSPHHGSANLDPTFMAVVRAPVTLISVGPDNDYGHPAPSHLALLGQLGTVVYRTDLRGDISVVDEGSRLRVRTSR